MCGIAGIWCLDGRKAAPEELQNMLSVQQHRGPEDAAYTAMENGEVLLGFLKLGFTDVQLGMQPLFNEDGSIAIVYNGEIYDYEELRTDLIKKGHRFYTQSDSEVLIHLYEEYGESFIERLNGEFAFVIYDERKQQLFAGRDPFGVNPLTYILKDATFYFSSEAKGILVTENFHRALSSDYLHSVAVGIPNTRLTLFEGIQNLRPGHCMVITKQGIQQHYQYWKPSFTKTKDDFLTAQAKVREQLKAAVARRLAGNPPIALSLSSGIDSSIIAGLSKELGYKLPVFSLGYQDRDFDEATQAAQTAKHYGLPFERVEISTEALVKHFAKSLFHTENTTNSLSNTARLLMHKAIRDAGLKAVSGGEASDEVFGGYPYFMLEALWRKDLKGENTKDLFKKFAKKEQKSHRIFWDQPRNWKTIPSPYSSPNLAFMRAQNAKSLSRLWHKDVRQRFINGNHSSTAKLFLEEVPPSHCSHLSGFDTTRLIARSVVSTFVLTGLGDRLEMGNSLEGRVPFLDKNVVEYAYTLPESYCLNMKSLEGKYILRTAFKSLLPPQFKGPAKHTFMSPTFTEGFATKLGKSLYNEYLSATKVKTKGVLNPLTFKLAHLLSKTMPKSMQTYLFIDSLLGLSLSVQLLQEIFVEKNPLDNVSLIPVRLLTKMEAIQ